MRPASWIGQLGEPTDISWLFGDGGGNHRQPIPRRSALEVLPRVYSFDPIFLGFLRKVVDEANEKLPASVNDRGFCGANGVAVDFSKGKCVAGWSMNPMSYVCNQNDDFATGLGLPLDYHSVRHRQIFEKLWDLVFAEWQPRPLRTPKHSSAGFPTFSYNAIWKRSAGLELLSDIEGVLNCYKKDGLKELAHKAGVVFCYNLNHRSQVDNLGKKRLVHDLLYAYTGGKKGRGDIVADKTVTLPGFPDFSGTRERVVQGAPYLTNLLPQALSTGHLYSLFERFAATFHHTDIKAMAESIPLGYSVVCSDISEYDRSMRTFLLDTMFERMRKKWDERLVDWIDTLLFAPYYTRPLEVDGKRGSFVGGLDLTRDEFPDMPFINRRQVFSGNRSGNALTSLIAKVMKVGDTLCVLDDLLGDCLERMEDYLSGNMPVTIKNNGDDECLIAPSAIVDVYRDYRFGEKQVGYFVAEEEKGQVFSGMMIVPRDGGGFTAWPRLNTVLEKTFIPERSINTVFRPYWPIGMMTRFEGSDNPSHGLLIDIIMKNWRDELTRHYGDLTVMLARAVDAIQFPVASLTAIEKEVLRNPRKLFYAISEDDVSDEIIAQIMGANIMPHEYKDFFRYYTGTIDLSHSSKYKL